VIRLREDVWKRLGAEPVRGEALRARLAVPELSNDLIAALGEDQERHLLVRIADVDPGIRDSKSRGVEVTTRDLSIPGGPIGRYLDVICKDASGHDVFDLIGGELAERLQGNETPVEVVERVLSKWRHFWGHGLPTLLSKEEQVGLFAELWLLLHWLIPFADARSVVPRWRGPHGARHDFEWPGTSIEVKATLSSRGPVHRIHGLDQLAEPDNGALFFFSLMLREEGGGGNSLTSIVQQCHEALAHDAQALEGFDDTLGRAGFSMALSDEYAAFRLRVVTEALYHVKEGFPRLRREGPSIAGNLASIERIDYDINLGGYEALRVATEPGQMMFP
jgi:hypothetical protein